MSLKEIVIDVVVARVTGVVFAGIAYGLSKAFKALKLKIINRGDSDVKIKPSNPYNVDTKPSGTVTKITDKMDDATKRSLMRENEAAETIAKNGYDIEQNPVVVGTTRNLDYVIEGEIFDCYSPAENTKIRKVASTIEEKVIKRDKLNEWYSI